MTARRAVGWAALVGVSLLATACVEDLTPATLIDRNRVLGARVVVAEDAARAWVRPGETFDVEWLVVDEAEPRTLSWAFVACPPSPAVAGVPDCGSGPLAIAAQPAPVAGPPRLAVTLPPDYAGDELLVLGLICAGGTISLDASGQSGTCSAGPDAQTTVTASVYVQRGDASNLHPDPSMASLLIGKDPKATGETAWPASASEPPLEGCLAAEHPPAFPVVTAGQEFTMLLRVDGAAREVFVEDGEERRESLIISHLATAGEIDGRFSVIDDRSPEADRDWKAPAGLDVPAAGLTVRFEFVVRDQRGGIGRLTRWACVAPAD